MYSAHCVVNHAAVAIPCIHYCTFCFNCMSETLSKERRGGTVSLGVVPSIWRVEVLRMLSPPAQDVAVAGEDG